jgi:hypothetical protein
VAGWEVAKKELMLMQSEERRQFDHRWTLNFRWKNNTSSKLRRIVEQPLLMVPQSISGDVRRLLLFRHLLRQDTRELQNHPLDFCCVCLIDPRDHDHCNVDMVENLPLILASHPSLCCPTVPTHQELVCQWHHFRFLSQQ